MFQEKKGVRIRREELLSAAKKLISRGLTIYYEDQKKFITIGILVSADYGEEEKKNHLILGFDPKLYPFLTNLKQRFTTYRLQAALTLKSKHSKRLYEMFSQFKDTGVMKVSLKELKTRLGLIDSETGKERYTAFGLFASKVLDVAQRELAKYTELRVKYKARKTGKEYTHLEFEISCSSLVTKSGLCTKPFSLLASNRQTRASPYHHTLSCLRRQASTGHKRSYGQKTYGFPLARE